MNDILTSDVLDLAADEIQRRGWRKGPLAWGDSGPEGGLCLEGGIAAALGESAPRLGWMLNTSALQRCPAYVAVQDFLDMKPGEELWVYNDQIATDADEVVAVLRAAAAVERAKEAVVTEVAA